MLPAPARLRRSDDFRVVIRRGRRSGRPRLVVHALTAYEPAGAGVQVGFVVSKAVGNSVVRNRVARRLRHLVTARLAELPPSSALVIRALPASATADSGQLAADLDAALRRLKLTSADDKATTGAAR